MTYYTTAFKRAEDLSEDDVIKTSGPWTISPWREILSVHSDANEMSRYYGLPEDVSAEALPAGTFEVNVAKLVDKYLDRIGGEYIVVRVMEIASSTPAEIADRFITFYRKDLVEVQRAEPDHVREFTERVAREGSSVMTIPRWEEPSPGARKGLDYAAAARKAKARRGRWLLIGEYPAGNWATVRTMASHISHGRVASMRSGFQGTSRRVGDVVKLYARYIGGEGS